MSVSHEFVEFKRGEKCPVCGHEGRCKNSTKHPNDLVLCFREIADEYNGFRRVKKTSDCTTYVRIGSPADGKRTTAPPRKSIDLNEVAQRFSKAITPEKLRNVAIQLGVSSDSLKALGIGWDGENIVFPERDANGNVTALNRRFSDGSKKVGSGQRRGLYIPDNLASLPDPILLVEGASDVAACLTMGLTAVGRPNNTYGAKLIAELLPDRKVIVIGENDPKTNGKWPGKEGAFKVAVQLATIWSKPVEWALPPENVKDYRDYLQLNSHRAAIEVGQELLGHSKAYAKTVSMPADGIKADSNGVADPNSFSSSNSLHPIRRWPGPLDQVAFHGIAGELVRIIEPHTEADPVAVLICFLVAMGNAIGRKVFFVADGVRHYANLFAVLMGETSKGRKGTAWAQASQRLIEVAQQWHEERISGGLSSGEGLIWQVRDPISGVVRNRKTKTTETTIVDAGVSDKRLMLIEAEFASVLRLVERQGNTLSAIVRKAWESGNLRALTKNSPAKATGAHISIIGDITVDELKRYLDRTEIANGFGNRFLWLCVRRSKCLPEGGNLDKHAFDELTSRLRQVLEFASVERQIHRDQAAKELWEKVYPSLSEGRPGLAGALTARAEAQVMRLAMVYAILDCSPLIRVEHLTAAIAIWEYCEASVVWCFGDATGDPIADAIMNGLRSAAPDGLTRTEISHLLGKNVNSARILTALAMLKSRRLARCVEEETEGRSAERWFV